MLISTIVPLSSGIRQVYTPLSSAVRLSSLATRLRTDTVAGLSCLILRPPVVTPASDESMGKAFPSRPIISPTPEFVEPERH